MIALRQVTKTFGSGTTAVRAVLFVYTAPFVVALGAHVFVPAERLRSEKELRKKIQSVEAIRALYLSDREKL